MSKINFNDKVENNGATVDGRLSSANINEIKTSVNNLYDIVSSSSSGGTSYSSGNGITIASNQISLDTTFTDNLYYTKSPQLANTFLAGATSGTSGLTTFRKINVIDLPTLNKSLVGLTNADDTSDINKPISTATQNALNLKANDNSVIHITGAETVTGIKTFTTSPIVPTPSTSGHASNKSYTDAQDAIILAAAQAYTDSHSSSSGGTSYSSGNGITIASNQISLDTTFTDSLYYNKNILQNPNTFLAGSTSGTAGVATFRNLNLNDMPVFTGYASSSGSITSTDTAFTAIQKLDGNIQNITSKQVGSIYTENFNSNTVSNNYTLFGGLTFVQSAGRITVGNGASNYTRYSLLKNFTMASDRFKFQISYILGDVNTTGLQFGIQTSTTSIKFGLDTTINATSIPKLIIGTNDISGVLADSNNSFSVATGDTIQIFFEYYEDTITVTYYNANPLTPNSLKIDYKLFPGVGTYLSPPGYSVGQLAVFAMGGNNHAITTLKIEDTNIYNPDYLIIGHSIVENRDAFDAENSFINQLRKRGVSIVRLSCPGALIADFDNVGTINYLNKINPKNIINFLSTNSINSLGSTTAFSQYQAWVTRVKNAGYNVIHCTELDRTGVTTAINTFNSSVKSTYPNDLIIDLNSDFGSISNTSLSSDGIHPSLLGQRILVNSFSKFLIANIPSIPTSKIKRYTDVLVLNGGRINSNATFTTTDTKITTFGGVGFGTFQYSGYAHIFDTVANATEIVYYSGRDGSAGLNGIRRGQFSTVPIAPAGASDARISTIYVLKTNDDNAKPYYLEYGTTSSPVSFAWNTEKYLSVSDIYTFSYTSSANIARHTSTTSLSQYYSKGATGDATEHQWLVNNTTIGYRQRHDATGNFFFAASASNAYIWNADSSRNFTIGNNTSVYRTTNAGSDITSQVFIDPARSIISGQGYSFDTSNGFVFTQSNTTRRIASSAIKLINTNITAGSESGDLGFYTQSAGTVLSLRATISSTGISTTLGLSTGYTSKTATYTILNSDYTIDCTSNSFTVTLPTAVGITGKIFSIVNSGTGTITLNTTSSQTISNSLSKIITVQYSGYVVQSNGSNWIIIGSF